MRNEWFCKISTSLRKPARARAFSLSELLIVVLIIGIILAIAVPSFTVIAKDIELKQARSDIFAALSAARNRAIRDRQMVALHIFRDTGPAYLTSGTPSLRWPNNPTHVPTNKMTMRLEVPNINVPVVDSNVPPGNFNHVIPGSQIVEFVWPADHDVITLPESLSVCRPQTNLANTVDISNEFTPSASPAVSLKFYEDFYIVFAEDGKPVSVMVDYNLNSANNNANGSAPFYTDAPGVQTQVSGAAAQTWSASGLCMYDMAKFKALNGNLAAQQTYANRPDNTITISPYTGLPMSSEATK